MGSLIKRMRQSAKAFRENDVYSQDGDAVRLTVQADELDEAATLIATLVEALGGLIAAIDTPRYGDDSIWDDLHGFGADEGGPLDRARKAHEAATKGSSNV